MEVTISNSQKKGELQEKILSGAERFFDRWRGWLLLLCCLVFAYAAGWFHWPFFIHPSKTGDNPSAQASLAIRCKPGAWGDLDYLPFYIEPPAEFLPVQKIENAPRIWNFEGSTSAQVQSLLDLTDLTAQQKDDLMATCAVLPDNEGVSVTPSSGLIVSMSEKTRKRIYGVLTQIQGNSAHDYRAFFPADHFDEFFSRSGLPPEIIKQVRQLSFREGGLLFFCDAPLVLSELKTPEEKMRFMKTISRKSTMLLGLHVTPNSDINELCNYWSRAAWGKDIRPMLESLARIPGGARMSIRNLLPPEPSANLFTFPFPSDNPEDLRKDCHYAAFNFFRDQPDPRFCADLPVKIPAIKQTVENDYYPVYSDPRYGDLVELLRPGGQLVHSSIFIADDIVYTKNSAQFLEPFMLMKIKDMVDAISSTIPEGESLQVRVFRSKYY